MRASLLTLAFLCAMLPAGHAVAHPGRLRADGCHVVRTEFHYSDGRVLQVGEEHCHRRLDQGFALDGKERLAPEPDETDDDAMQEEAGE